MPQTPEQKLIGEGWEKKATYDEPRLSEMVATYEEIGLEVHLEPFDASNEEGCTDCMRLFPDQFKTIYTRKKANPDKAGRSVAEIPLPGVEVKRKSRFSGKPKK